MIRLSIEKIQNENDINISFTCGLEYIDDYIKNSFYSFLCKHQMILLCKINNQIVGYILYCIDSVDCRQTEKMTDYFADSKSFGVVYMNYIAIEIDKQHNGYGKKFLSSFIKFIKQYSKSIPLRFIVIESLKDKTGWYSNIGFKILDNETHKENPQMFYDLLDKEEKDSINNYIGGSI